MKSGTNEVKLSSDWHNSGTSFPCKTFLFLGRLLSSQADVPPSQLSQLGQIGHFGHFGQLGQLGQLGHDVQLCYQGELDKIDQYGQLYQLRQSTWLAATLLPSARPLANCSWSPLAEEEKATEMETIERRRRVEANFRLMLLLWWIDCTRFLHCCM